MAVFWRRASVFDTYHNDLPARWRVCHEKIRAGGQSASEWLSAGCYILGREDVLVRIFGEVQSASTSISDGISDGRNEPLTGIVLLSNKLRPRLNPSQRSRSEWSKVMLEICTRFMRR